MKFSDWLKENDYVLHILVTRYLGQWGFNCQIIKTKDADKKTNFLSLVTNTDQSNGKHVTKSLTGFGADKFSSVSGLLDKVKGNSLCYANAEKSEDLIEVPGDLSLGEKADYAGLIKGENSEL